jgi:hypothetical protein
VQLALPHLTVAEQSWFEGSVDPWITVEQPSVDWTAVVHVLELVGLGPATLDAHEQQLLRRLPYLYERGVSRTIREVWGRSLTPRPEPTRSATTRPQCFSTVGCLPVVVDDSYCFWTVRLGLGVLRNVVVTVRLPDIYWDGDEFRYEPARSLVIPARFFPTADDVGVEDVAQGIALHQASTAREVTNRIRPELTAISRRWARETDGPSRTAALSDAQRVTELTDTLYRLDRQVARLLRRIGPAGPDDPVGMQTMSGLAMRYRFALDELRSLEADCRLASDTVSRAISKQEHDDRERFHLVAALLASAILIPTLVATVYGANVKLPAEQTLRGFIALMLFIVACASAGWLAISVWWQRAWGPDGTELRHAPAIVAAVVAVAAFAAGVIEVT